MECCEKGGREGWEPGCGSSRGVCGTGKVRQELREKQETHEAALLSTVHGRGPARVN